MAKKRRAGGLKAEAPDCLTQDVRVLVDRILARNDPGRLAEEFLRSKDLKLRERVWELLLAYRYGKPAQALKSPRSAFSLKIGKLPRRALSDDLIDRIPESRNSRTPVN